MSVFDANIRRATPGDLQAISALYNAGLIESKMSLSPTAARDMAKFIGDFVVAEHGGRIVSQMALTYPHRIVYLSNEEKFVDTTDAFLHIGYTVSGFRSAGLGAGILERLEKDARANDRIGFIYGAAENKESQKLMERAGYDRVGKECRTCAGWSMGICKGVPVYRKRRPSK